MVEIQEQTARSLQWLEWARQIQALAQTGMHYAVDEYQRERNQHLSVIAAEILAACTDLPFDSVRHLFLSERGYATPRVDVRGVVFQDNRLLLVRERQDGGWTLPGGWADVGDRPSQAVEREIWEEAGYRARVLRLIGVYDANRVEPLDIYQAYKLVFLCEPIGGESRTSHETSEVAFFGAHEIPEHLSGERTRRRHILDAFRAHADASLPTVFD